jgi:HAD superfamily hydrolase (TIGR01484 family)
MKPVAQLSSAVCRGLRGLLCDLDDTLTTEGKLLPEAYEALWRLQRAGLRVVVITGRPAGWADHLARMWPVDGVVGENGAFYFCLDQNSSSSTSTMHRRWVDDEATREANGVKLAELAQRMPVQVPGAAISADQFCRVADLAVDFCEDVAPLPAEAVDRIVQEFVHVGATAKVSSIHVNGWFGSYDKLECFRLMARERWQEELEAVREQYVFCGDSPNDEPMFAFFPHATAVANIVETQSRLRHLPAYVTSQPGGLGFAELAAHILAHR